jgi:hypothetical protein
MLPPDQQVNAAPRPNAPGRQLFGPIGAAAARALKGDIERSIERFDTLYA